MSPADCDMPCALVSPSQFRRSTRAPFVRWKCATGSRALPFDAFSCTRYCAQSRISAGFTASERPSSLLHWLEVRIRSEEHTSELQSLMRISYAVFCLKKKKNNMKTYTPDYI